MDEIKTGTSRPSADCMEGHREQRLAQRMRENPEFFINAAMYAANDISTGERLLLLEEALRFTEMNKPSHDEEDRGIQCVKTIPHWKSVTAVYPEIPLGKERDNRTFPDMPVRAFYMVEAVTALLKIAEAPDAMQADFRQFMKSRLPIAAKQRAKIQKAILENPTWSNTKIAEKFKYDLTRLGRELIEGTLVRWPEAEKP